MIISVSYTHLKENYIDYISHRPRVEKLGEHGLFSDVGLQFELNDVVKEIGEHEGNVWTHIISIKREDATRLGFDSVQSWMSLCQEKRNDLAKAMKIDPNNLKWFAAFHNEGHHPHIHMVAYSKNPKEGYLTKKGICLLYTSTRESLREILLLLNSICVGSDSRFFNGHTNIHSQKVVTFGVKDLLQANKSLKDAMLFNILSYMSNELLKRG